MQPPIPPSNAAFIPADKKRIKTLRDRVRNLMEDGSWRTLGEIKTAVGGSEAGISARLRDLRKAPLNLTVDKRRRNARGLWEYQLVNHV
jgi:hypothetical protein